MITRQSRFHSGVLRQPPSGLDALTAAAVRGGYLRVLERGGVVWLPLGAQAVDRLRLGLSAIPVDWGKVIPMPRAQASPLLELVQGELRSYRDLPVVASAERRSTGEAGRSLRDLTGLPVLEWVAGAAEPDAAEAALAPVVGHLMAFLERCGVPAQRAQAGRDEWLWVWPHPEGPRSFLRCGTCQTMAEVDVAAFALIDSPDEVAQPLREVATPGATTIKLLCEQLGTTPPRTLKALFLATAEGDTLLVLLRGDLEASPRKLRDALGTSAVRPASESEIAGLGAVPGYAGPVGLDVRATRRDPGLWIVADRSVSGSPNLVTGANRDGWHLTGVNYPRDYAVTEILDIARAPRAARCPRCNSSLAEERGFVMAQQRLLRRSFSYITPEGPRGHGTMVSVQVSVEALFASVFSASMHAKGVSFPPACAPFHVHLLALPGGGNLETVGRALEGTGVDILLDDRDASAGEKFAEAEWVGAPVVVVAGRRSSAGEGVEVRMRGREPVTMPIEDVPRSILGFLTELM